MYTTDQALAFMAPLLVEDDVLTSYEAAALAPIIITGSAYVRAAYANVERARNALTAHKDKATARGYVVKALDTIGAR